MVECFQEIVRSLKEVYEKEGCESREDYLIIRSQIQQIREALRELLDGYKESYVSLTMMLSKFEESFQPKKFDYRSVFRDYQGRQEEKQDETPIDHFLTVSIEQKQENRSGNN